MSDGLLTGLDAQLHEALAECGRLIEEMPWDERHERVDKFMESGGLLEGLSGYTRDFVIGVMVNAHEHRLAYQEWVRSLPPVSGSRERGEGDSDGN